MSDFIHRISKLSNKQLILLADQLNSRLEKSDSDAAAPIAVVGIGCKFPGGADNPDLFWDLLLKGYDGTEEIGMDRWDIDQYYDPDPDVPGKMNTRRGGFIKQMDHFDAEFFGISPREATSMDPQQRLLLEVAWETLEYAGINPHQLSGSAAGIFAGICNSDYFQMMRRDTEAIDAYLATGSAHSIASGRISYVLNLTGPSVSVDTACSSSLVAVHMACQSLRLGECRLALAGGVNVINVPETTITLTKSHLMAPDGRCKTFDKTADGFVRSEGCGWIAIKKLADAQADGDTVMAVILGTAANQDGRSGGITAPNGPSQTNVIRSALKNARLRPADIDYVEAHGTGTALGDPIEMRALGEVFAKERDRHDPLIVGSVKTNIGHAESAAGIAGLIKLVLAVYHGEIPSHLNYNTPNPEIPWSALPVEIPVKRRAWPQRGDRRIGSVSSFGFSGTNAHVIVAQAPPKETPNNIQDITPQLILLSAARSDDLNRLARSYRDHLDKEPMPALIDISRTLAQGRAHFKYRAAFVTESLEKARKKLGAIGSDQKHSGVHINSKAVKEKIKIAFLFTGQGSQYPGMGHELLEHFPQFRRTMEQCDALLSPLINHSLMDLLYSPSTTPSLLDQTRYTQPVLFAFEYALANLWHHWGLEPTVVMGHSLGEYVAACVAGLFSLEDGMKLIVKRAELMQTAPGNGSMAAVLASENLVRPYLTNFGADLAIAAVNGPEQTVISGDAETLKKCLLLLDRDEIPYQPLTVSHGFHSKLMEPVMEAFSRIIHTVNFMVPKIPIISNTTGSFAKPGLMENAEYWQRHTLNPVQCLQSFRTLHAAGFRHFLEIGPKPILSNIGQQCIQDDGTAWHCSLNPTQTDSETILNAIAAVYTNGANFRWDTLPQSSGAKKIPLPTYPFRAKRYWLTDTHGQLNTSFQQLMIRNNPDKNYHPLLGQRLLSPALKDKVFESFPTIENPSFLKAHRIFGECIMPTPAYIEAALAASEHIGLITKQGGSTLQYRGKTGIEIRDIHVDSALPLTETFSLRLQTVVSQTEDNAYKIRFYSSIEDSQSPQWHAHAGCRICAATSSPPESQRLDITEIQQRCSTEWGAEQFYEGLDTIGLDFGDAFRGLQRIWRQDGEALGEMELPSELIHEQNKYTFHPALLDACFHLAGGAIFENAPREPYLLIGIERFRIFATPPERFWNHVRLNRDKKEMSESVSVDLWLFDENGRIFADIKNMLLRRTDTDALKHTSDKNNIQNLLYKIAWKETLLPEFDAATETAALPPVSEAVPELHDMLKEKALQFGLNVYGQLIPVLDRICSQAVCETLQTAGLRLTPGTEFHFKEICGQMNLLPRHHRLLQRLLNILIEDGVITEQENSYRVLLPWKSDAQIPTEDHLLQQFPSCRGEIGLTFRTIEELPQILSGAIEPLNVLFPEGDTTIMEQIYCGSPYAKTFNTVLSQAVLKEMDLLLKRQPLVRILEIGAGTGGTTTHVLSALPDNGIEYVFSDISPLFIHKAKEEFRRYPYVFYNTLDIEIDPDEQGFAGRRFDVVIAANIVHATRDLSSTLVHINKLLVPDGLLLMLEGTSPQRWVDVTFGLTDGWWRFEDTDIRPDYPLISEKTWKQLLSRKGMTAASISLDDPAAAGDVLRQTLITARKKPPVKTESAQSLWTLFSNGESITAAFKQTVCDHADIAVTVDFGSDCQPIANGHGTIRKEVLADYVNVLTSMQQSAQNPEVNILFLADLDDSSAPNNGYVSNTLHALHFLMKAMTEVSWPQDRAKLWICTVNGQAVIPSHNQIKPNQSTLWGLGRVFSLEHPRLFGGLIDLDGETEIRSDMKRVIQHIRTDPSEDQIAFRDQKRLAARIIPAQETLRFDRQFELKKDASYLITGGTGGLGMKLTEWLAEKGAARIYLISRTRFPDRDQWSTLETEHPLADLVDRIRKIESTTGTRIETLSGDVGDKDAITALMTGLKARQDLPLRGIIHTAVEMSSATLSKMQPEMLDGMMHAKVGGACMLDRLTADLELDFFVLFSSSTSLLGVAGLGHYAAANQFLDALAHQRRALGLPALSINWGTWEEMRIASAKEKAGFSQVGLNPLKVKTALAALERMIVGDDCQICVASIEWSQLLSVYQARRSRPFFDQIQSEQIDTAIAVPTEDQITGRLQQLAATPAERRSRAIRVHLEKRIRQILRLERDIQIDPDKGLFEMGMDSLMAVELKNKLEKDAGITLPSTLTFNYPTIGELTGYFNDQLEASAGPTAETPSSEVKEELPSALEAESASEEELSDMLMRKLEELK